MVILAFLAGGVVGVALTIGVIWWIDWHPRPGLPSPAEEPDVQPVYPHRETHHFPTTEEVARLRGLITRNHANASWPPGNHWKISYVKETDRWRITTDLGVFVADVGPMLVAGWLVNLYEESLTPEGGERG